MIGESAALVLSERARSGVERARGVGWLDLASEEPGRKSMLQAVTVVHCAKAGAGLPHATGLAGRVQWWG